MRSGFGGGGTRGIEGMGRGRGGANGAEGEARYGLDVEGAKEEWRDIVVRSIEFRGGRCIVSRVRGLGCEEMRDDVVSGQRA